jgi:prepilin-type N-terminal cleavage/methylation domain-containing protein
MTGMMRKYGFTLIELLIVVAIIAILAAIAVPNFLEAQTRAKISRAKSDLRTITTGVETYHIDSNTYPLANWQSWAMTFGATDPRMLPTLERLTTPIAYLNGGATYKDPFVAKAQYSGAQLDVQSALEDVTTLVGAPADAPIQSLYRYVSLAPEVSIIWNSQAQGTAGAKPVWYLLESCGPDAHYHRVAGGGSSWVTRPDNANRRKVVTQALYDSTNGTTSRGSIWRGGGGSGKGSFFKDMIAATN